MKSVRGINTRLNVAKTWTEVGMIILKENFFTPKLAAINSGSV